MIKYSIIIPHHNIPKLLRRCLKTIPWRQDVQVIVVDNGSDEEAEAVLRGMEREKLAKSFKSI